MVSGTAATAIQGTIGGTNAISSLTITNGTANGTIEIANIEGVTGATAIGNTNTTTITLDGTAYSTDGTQTYTAAAGQNIDITGVATFTTSNDNISFATSGVDLANNGTTTINTGTAGGTVSFGAAIEGNSASAPFNDLLVITSGTGNVTFTGAIGATNALGGLTVNSSQGNAAITFTSTIGDTGNAGVVGTTAIGNTTTTDLNFNGATYSFDGTTTITAASGDTIDIGAAATFTTAADNITFATGNIELANGSNLTVDTGAAGGNITIGEIAVIAQRQ